MKILLRSIVTLFFPFAACSSVALADALQQWQFEDAEGTSLSQAQNSGTGGANFDNDLEESATSGKGAFRIRRSIRTQANSYARLEPPIRDGTFWLVTEIAGWNLTGTVGEAVRIGFSSSSPATADPFVAVQFKIERAGGTQDVVLHGEAFGDGTKLEQTATFAVRRDQPLTVALRFNKSENSYAVFYKDGEGDFIELGTGKIDAGRSGRFIRLGSTGEFATNPAEFFDIGSITLTEKSPL